MGWYDTMIERHREDVARMKKSIELYESGQADIGERDDSGRLTSFRNEMVASYKRTIAELEGIIERYDNDKSGD